MRPEYGNIFSILSLAHHLEDSYSFSLFVFTVMGYYIKGIREHLDCV